MKDVNKVWKKKTREDNYDSGFVSFSVEDKLAELCAGQRLEVYEPKGPKVAKNCRGYMIITQADIDAMELCQHPDTKQHYYLMAYKLTK